jgi:uncharacterized protein YndB with AHSA1/START domain
VPFEYSRTVTSSAPPEAVWALWSDPASWSSWDPAVESVAFEGHFGEGAAGKIVLTGGVEAPITVESVEPGRRFLDRLAMGDLVIEIDHVVLAVDGGSEITVSTTINGTGADDIGPMVTADSPRAMAALVALAEGS